MIERFRYNASATGVSGRITQPFDAIIPVKASLALPETGGFATVRFDRFDFHGILSFETAEAVVAGSYSVKGESYDATATVTVTGLNILNMVTADRVVARIASSHPADSEQHFISPLGSSFENLRIVGYPVCLDLATDTFARLGTAEQVRTAYKKNENGFHDEFDRLTLTGREDVPGFLQKYFPCAGRKGSRAIEEAHGVISCSLVRDSEGLPRELGPLCHVVHVPGFGTVRLAEFKITDSERSINMIQVDLGSTPSGHVSIGGGQGNGSDW